MLPRRTQRAHCTGGYIAFPAPAPKKLRCAHCVQNPWRTVLHRCGTHFITAYPYAIHEVSEQFKGLQKSVPMSPRKREPRFNTIDCSPFHALSKFNSPQIYSYVVSTRYSGVLRKPIKLCPYIIVPSLSALMANTVCTVVTFARHLSQIGRSSQKRTLD